MAYSSSAVAFLVLLLSVYAVDPAHSAGNSAAPAPGVDCTTLVLSMADCLSFVSAGSTVNKPEGSCCSGLKSVLKTDAECLCEAFKNSANLGVSLNMTKAMTLPAACKVSAPSATNCNLSAGPSAAPGSSAAAPGAAATGPSSSSSGANAESPIVQAPTPAPGNGSSACNALVYSAGPLFISLVAAFLALY